MTGKIFACLLATVLLTTVSSVEAQQTKVFRVGVIHHGGPYKAVVDGLRDGFRQSEYEEVKQIRLDIRDTKSDLKTVEEAARDFERERVNLIYVVTTSAATVVKDATSHVPIVFSVGSDPVKSGFVQSFAKPEGGSRVYSIRPRI
jgi:putative tryptophan/tyrosine transport system substrate-binding protein